MYARHSISYNYNVTYLGSVLCHLMSIVCELIISILTAYTMAMTMIASLLNKNTAMNCYESAQAYE